MAVPAVRVVALITVNAPQRDSGQITPAGSAAGVPATYRLVPFIIPTVAPETGIGALKATGVLVKSAKTTLAGSGIGGDPCVVPHSPAQFRMKACVSLPLNTAVNGWSRCAASVTAVTAEVAVSTTKKVLVLGGICACGSGKTSSLVPLGLITSRRALLMRSTGRATPVVVSTDCTKPKLRMAAQAFLPSGLMAISKGWSPMGEGKVTVSVGLSMTVIRLLALSMAMVVPPAVSILVGEDTARTLALNASFFASITVTVPAVVLESNTLLLSPVGLGVLLLVPEPQPVRARARLATKKCEK